MSIKDRVQEKQQSVAVQNQQQELTPAQLLKNAVQAQTSEFATVLPKTVDADRFSRLVLTAIKSTPDLMQCFNTQQGKISIFFAAMQAAALGLEPNTPTQECWLLPRQNRGVWECELSIGFRGYIKLAIKNGQEIIAGVVREGDDFTHKTTLHRDILEHTPLDEDGELIYAYAIVRKHLPNDQVVAIPKVMNRKAIEKRRAMSVSWKSEKGRPYSPWTKWTEEMWMKTAIRGLVPYMDLSPEVKTALANDDSVFTLDENNQLQASQRDWTAEAIEVQTSNSEQILVNSHSHTDSPIEQQTAEQPLESSEPVVGPSAVDDEPVKNDRAQPASSVDVLKAIFTERSIRGPLRWETIAKHTGAQVKNWDEVTEDIAEEAVVKLEEEV